MEENAAVLETPEVIKHTDTEWYRDVSLEDAEVFIRSNLQSAVRSVIATGFYLKHIRDNELYLEAGYKNINEYAMPMPTGKIITWIDLRKLNKAIEFSVDF